MGFRAADIRVNSRNVMGTQHGQLENQHLPKGNSPCTFLLHLWGKLDWRPKKTIWLPCFKKKSMAPIHPIGRKHLSGPMKLRFNTPNKLNSTIPYVIPSHNFSKKILECQKISATKTQKKKPAKPTNMCLETKRNLGVNSIAPNRSLLPMTDRLQLVLFTYRWMFINVGIMAK